MDIDRLIDLNLSNLYKRGLNFSKWEIIAINNNKNKESKYVIEIMEEYGLICGENDNYNLTIEGKSIYRNGGWLIHKEQETKEEQERIERIKNNDELVKSSIKANKINIKKNMFYKITKIISIIILILGFIWQIFKN